MRAQQTGLKHILYADGGEGAAALDALALAHDVKFSLAANGQEVEERLRSDSFDLVVLDMDMPALNGVEAARMIRGTLGKSPDALPILALVKNDTQEQRATCFEAGIDDFLSKPFNDRELLEKILQWLDSESHDSFTEAARLLTDTDLDAHPLIDETQVDTFIKFIGIPRTREIIKDFRDFYDRKIDVIFDMASSADLVGRELHAMASVSGNIGMRQFSIACRSLMNDLGSSGDIPGRLDRLMQVQVIYNRSIEKLDALLHSMGDES